MIAKISTGVFTYGMVKYNHDKTIASDNGNVEALILGVNMIQNDNFDTIVSTIMDSNNKNLNVEKSNIHISLNFHKDDILDNNSIYKIAQDYMEQMGYKDQPYAIYRHFDKEHPHVHIVSSQINRDRKKINDSHIYYKSQALTRELEIKYGITKAVEKNEIFSKKDIETAINEHLEQGKHSLTAIMKTVLNEVLVSKPTSVKQFERKLEEFQMRRIIANDNDGSIKGHSFYLLPIDQLENENFYSSSKGIGAAELDNTFSYQSIETQIQLNLKQKEALQKGIMGRLYAVVNPIKEKQRLSLFNPENNDPFQEKLSNFTTDLKKKGIELIVKRSQTGDDPNSIYGLLFKDIKSGQTYTATEVKIKTKEFMKFIFDDLKNLPDKEKNLILGDLNDTRIDDFKFNSLEDNSLNIFDMLSEIAKNNSTAGVPEDATLGKNKRKRKKGI